MAFCLEYMKCRTQVQLDNDNRSWAIYLFPHFLMVFIKNTKEKATAISSQNIFGVLTIIVSKVLIEKLELD